MTVLATSFVQSTNFIDAAYIVAFSLLIYGMSGLTGPRTAVRGNQIAALGMAVAVVATLVLLGNAEYGLPVSTTHVITSSVMGVGATQRASAVRWGVAGNILLAWVLTLPAAAVVAAVAYEIARLVVR